jgi:hypothetical protein
MIDLPLLNTPLRTRLANGKAQIWDLVRRQWVFLTPEEHVRQALMNYLVNEMHYPQSLIAVERGLTFGHTTLRFDIVVYHRNTEAPWMLAECKSPDVSLTDASLHQLLQYQGKLPLCSFWLLTNGYHTFCADATDRLHIQWMNRLPAY